MSSGLVPRMPFAGQGRSQCPLASRHPMGQLRRPLVVSAAACDDQEEEAWWKELAPEKKAASPAPPGASQVWGTSGAMRAPRGIHGCSLQDWRLFRARLVSQEQSGGFRSTGAEPSMSAQPAAKPESPASCNNARASTPSASHPIVHRGEKASTSQPRAAQGKSLAQRRSTHQQSPTSSKPPQCTAPQPHQGSEGARQSLAPKQPQQRKPHSKARSFQPLHLGPGPASWAHLLNHVEPGCLLLSAGGPDVSSFDRTVIMVTSHDDAKGSVGFVLNKASPMKVRELQLAAACPGFIETFSSQRLQIGGHVHLDHVTVLHRFMGLAGAKEIGDRLFTGGLPDAVRLVSAGLARPQDFFFMLGVSGWAPRQLASEVAAGMWHVVSASSDLMLPRRAHNKVDTASLSREGQDMWARTLEIAAGPGAVNKEWI